MIGHKTLSATLMASALCLAVVPGMALARNSHAGSHGHGGTHGNSVSTASFNDNTDGSGTSNGSIASELKWMNSAHANQNARDHAAPNSRPGMDEAYRQAVLDLNSADGKVTTAGNTLYQDYLDSAALNGDTTVSQETFLADPTTYINQLTCNSDGSCTSNLSSDTKAYSDALSTQSDAQTTEQNALDTASGGRTLSDAALSAYNSLLGLVQN